MSAAVAAAAATISGYQSHHNNSSESSNHSISNELRVQQVSCVAPRSRGRYELQKRRDWHMFGQYLKDHRPPLTLSRCSGAHVLEFLRYIDQFGKAKIHSENCAYFGNLHPPGPCPCPLKQGWCSVDALVGRLRVAFEENGGLPEMNPFDSRTVRLYLKEVRDSQDKARGRVYEKKKRRKQAQKNMEEDNHNHIHHHDLHSGIRRAWWCFC